MFEDLFPLAAITSSVSVDLLLQLLVLRRRRFHRIPLRSTLGVLILAMNEGWELGGPDGGSGGC